jgi:hypothetical protein
MPDGAYKHLQEKAFAIASALARPVFYDVHAAAVGRADAVLASHALIRKCRSFLDAAQLECAHGVCHCESVARDAGALVLIEAPVKGIAEEEHERLFLAALIAGLLHDIKRKEKNHAVLGSLEAEKILSTLGMEEKYRRYVTEAIKNHEAFKETRDADNAAGRLVSDALYDADKFRWGPENFTTTVWLMVEDRHVPLEALHRTFQESMKGIEKIKTTFRTETGKRYGPEFIDQGIAIGNAIYVEMNALIDETHTPNNSS